MGVRSLRALAAGGYRADRVARVLGVESDVRAFDTSRLIAGCIAVSSVRPYGGGAPRMRPDRPCADRVLAQYRGPWVLRFRRVVFRAARNAAAQPARPGQRPAPGGRRRFAQDAADMRGLGPCASQNRQWDRQTRPPARRRNSVLAHFGVEVVAGLRATWATSTSPSLDRAVRAEARTQA